MVIECPECNTRYNLPEDRLGPQGKKMRCARCKAIFFADPANALPESPPEEAPAFSSEEAAPDFSSSFEEPAQEEMPSEDPIFEAFDDSSTEDAEDGFDFSSFDDTAEETAVEENGLSESDGYDDGFVMEDESDEDSTFDFAFSSEDTSDAEAALSDVDQLLSDAEDDGISELEEEAPVAAPLPAKKDRGPMSLVKTVLLLLLLAILGGMGYLMATDGVDAPMNFIQQLLGN